MTDNHNQTHSDSHRVRGVRINPWVWLALLWLAGLALGYSGLLRYAAGNSESQSPLDLVYRLLQLITLESGSVPRPIPWQLEIARFGLPLLAAWTALRAVMALFREQAARFSLRYWHDHIVICGLGQRGSLLTQEFLENGRRVVVIEHNDDNPLLEQARQLGAVVLVRDATDPRALLQAGIQRAAELIAVTGSDGANAELAVQVVSLLTASRPAPLHCLVHIVDPEMWDLLREWQLTLVTNPYVRIELFNIYQRGAELLLDQHPTASDTTGGTSPEKYLVVGLGDLGRNVVLSCAERWFRQRADPQERIRLIAVDRHASFIVAALAARYPQLKQSLSIQCVDIELDSADFLSGAYLNLQHDPSPFDTVFICLDDDALAVTSAMNVRRQLSGMETEVILRSKAGEGLAQLALQAAGASGTFPHLRAFMLVEETCTKAIFRLGTHERLARALHESYLRSQSQVGVEDPARWPWPELPEHLREANRRQADRMVQLLHKAGISLSVLRDWGESPFELSAPEVEELACLEHQRWCEEKKRQGWRHATGPKDEQARTHPDLVGWEDLPEAEREKNRVPVRAIPSLLHKAGITLRRAEI